MTQPLIPIIHEHPDFIAINKPVGISVQNEQDSEGILPQLCEQLALPKLWLVHRLDKVTSGVLLLGKNSDAARELSQQFAQRLTEKYYLALSHKKPSKKQGTISGDMQKARGGQWKLTQTQDNPAVTQFFSQGLGQGMRLFLVKPVTGKTHQIRVALKSLGSPILGDSLYKGQAADRTYLHAFRLSFRYDNTPIHIQCPVSSGEYFTSENSQEALRSMLPPEQLNWPKLPAKLLQKIGKSGQGESDFG